MYISTDYCIVFCESIRRVSCELIYASYSPDCQEEEAVVGPDQPFARTQPANFAVKTSSWRLCSSTNSYSAGSGEKAWPIFCACLKQNTGLLTLVMKRSSSAPMIPELLDPKPSHLHASLQSRRGLSASNMSLPGDYGKLEFSPRKQVRACMCVCVCVCVFMCHCQYAWPWCMWLVLKCSTIIMHPVYCVTCAFVRLRTITCCT